MVTGNRIAVPRIDVDGLARFSTRNLSYLPFGFTLIDLEALRNSVQSISGGIAFFGAPDTTDHPLGSRGGRSLFKRQRNHCLRIRACYDTPNL